MLGTPIATPSSGSGFGFTYDQQTEPSSPTAGHLWRERSAGGLVVGEWEWSGSLWLGRLTELGTAVVTNVAATQNPSLNAALLLNNRPIQIELVIRYYLATADGSNNWTIAPRGNAEGASTIPAASFGTDLLVTLNTGEAAWRDTSSTATFNFRGAISALTLTRVGTPGNLSMTTLLRYRRIR